MKKSFVLMNKDHPVLETAYDDELQVFTELTSIDLRFAPPGILWPKGDTDRRQLNEWWNNRAVPSSRMEKAQAKDLLMENLGLSLSDRYWMNPGGLAWEDVNLFDHGMSLMDVRPQSGASYSPDASTGGDLPKQWIRTDEIWELHKHGSGTLKQEPYNEAVATALHRRFLEDDGYVPYWVDGDVSICPNMLKGSEELVPAWDILKNVKKPNEKSGFQHCFDTLSGRLGQVSVQERYEFLEKMFVCDVILANSDRHYRNFGMIRDTDTLQYIRMAPVFDTGSCLWYDKSRLVYSSDYDYESKPFGCKPEKLLTQFHDLSWVDPGKLADFKEEAGDILSGCPYLPDYRLDAVMQGIGRNIEMVGERAESCRNRQYAGFTDAVNRIENNGRVIE